MHYKPFHCLIILVLPCIWACQPGITERRTIQKSELQDKIAGGWAGRIIGTSYAINSENTPALSTRDTSAVRSAFYDQNTGIQLIWMMGMDSLGKEADAKKLQELLARSDYQLWHANAQARKNYFDSIFPPQSGHPQNNAHADDNDFQNISGFIGLTNPGMPDKVLETARKAGSITSYGDGLYGGIFFAALYSEAFFTSDLEALVEKALATIPAGSDYALMIQDVLMLYRHNTSNWHGAWKELERKWLTTDACLTGSDKNIDAKLNGAYTVLGLIFGGGDLDKTMNLLNRMGQDVTANISNAAALLGVIHGYSQLPQEFRDAIQALENSLLGNTRHSYRKVIETTLKLSQENIRNNGGAVSGNDCEIVRHSFRAPALQVSFPEYTFQRRISVFATNNWEFKGNWQIRKRNENAYQSMYSADAGDEAILRFDGAGVFIAMNWMADCGKADIYVDGMLKKTVDCYYNHAGQQLTGMNIYVAGDMRDGEHTVRIVVRGEKRPESEGANIYISEAVIFKALPKVNRNFRFNLN